MDLISLISFAVLQLNANDTNDIKNFLFLSTTAKFLQVGHKTINFFRFWSQL